MKTKEEYEQFGREQAGNPELHHAKTSRSWQALAYWKGRNAQEAFEEEMRLGPTGAEAARIWPEDANMLKAMNSESKQMPPARNIDDFPEYWPAGAIAHGKFLRQELFSGKIMPAGRLLRISRSLYRLCLRHAAR